MRSIGSRCGTLVVVLAVAGCAASTHDGNGADADGAAGTEPVSAVTGGASGASGASGAAASGSGGVADFDNAAASGGAGAQVGDADPPSNGIGADAGLGFCGVGSAGSFATDESLDLFGEVTYFHGGKALPAGRYRVQYVDGCMKYSAPQDWAVHAFQDGSDAFWLVGDTTDQRVMMPPGTYGYLVGMGGHAGFDECVAANLALDPVEFEFAGGRLGVWLQDSPYSDNLAGVDGRNPTWSLTLLGDCALLE